MVGVVEHEGRGLIDRRGARAGGGIGLCTGMHGKGRKSGNTFVHASSLVRKNSVKRRGEAAVLQASGVQRLLSMEDNRVRENCRQGDFASSWRAGATSQRSCLASPRFRNNRFALAVRMPRCGPWPRDRT